MEAREWNACYGLDAFAFWRKTCDGWVWWREMVVWSLSLVGTYGSGAGQGRDGEDGSEELHC